MRPVLAPREARMKQRKEDGHRSPDRL